MNNGKKNDTTYNTHLTHVILSKMKDASKTWNTISNDNKLKPVNIEISIKDIK